MSLSERGTYERLTLSTQHGRTQLCDQPQDFGKEVLGIATSAIWKATSRPWLTIFAGRRSTYSRSATLQLYRHLPCVPATMSRLRNYRSFADNVATRRTRPFAAL